MAGNTFGRLFQLTTFGESHGPVLGGIIDGCPAGLVLDLTAVAADLARRRPGQSTLTTSRKEADEAQWLSGLVEADTAHLTTGTPIGFTIANTAARPADYGHLAGGYRPSHADYVYDAKYGVRHESGGGRASARETAARVAGGAIARQLIAREGISLAAYVERIEDIAMPQAPAYFERTAIDTSPVRCPDPGTAAQMAQRIAEVRKAGDTVGGTVVFVARGVPAGWGEPVFDKLNAVLAHAFWSIPAVKGMELGSGFHGSTMRGSAHNDRFETRDHANGKTIGTTTNRSGGIQGGISNGEDITVRLAFKPVATIMQPQETVDREGIPVRIEGRGRHDPCVLPRAVAIVEAMGALALADLMLQQRAARV